jgi:DNA-directed RNA polymerase, alpha subunit
MIEFEKPNVECVERNKENTYGKFVCEPLERGYGITLGNALRRILLSSLPGAAITGIKIDGVQHEFTTIPNIVEDVMEIILNLKSVRFKMETNEPTIIKLNVNKEGEIVAGDIEVPAGLEVLNKELYIATASEGVNLKMEMTVEKGRGYNTVERNRKQDSEINYLAIDSIFTPVKKVNYTTENTRVGDKTDFEKLVMEIWTDGSLTPDEAIGIAAKIMYSHLDLFIELSEKAKQTEVMVESEEDTIENILNLSIDELGLSKRPLNCLRIQEVKTVSELIDFTLDEVKKFKNLGAKSLQEIVDKVAELGLEFKKED